MPCPTCDHTMNQIGHNGSRMVGYSAHGGEPARIFWCPRCGTIRTGNDKGGDVPNLVGRCRDFQNQVIGRKTERADDVWRRTGIAESINLPDNRPI